MLHHFFEKISKFCLTQDVLFDIIKSSKERKTKEMRRQDKEQFKNNIKLFYISSIKHAGGFDWWLDNWLFYQASMIFGISIRTAKRYFFQLVPKDFINKYQY